MIKCLNDRVIEWGLIMLVLLLFSCEREPRPLIIATAASNRPALEVLVEDFTAVSGIEADLVVAASGQLTAQILAGAPYDVFISADSRYPQKLMEAGLIEGEPTIFARGSLVLWSTRSNVKPGLNELDSESRLSIANPKIAPFGRLADSLLRLRSDYEQRIAPWLVYGESIGQVNQFIISGGVDMGLTARSIVKETSHGQWIPFHPEVTIPQTVCVIDGKRETQGKEFVDFLVSPQAKKALQDFGYLIK